MSTEDAEELESSASFYADAASEARTGTGESGKAPAIEIPDAENLTFSDCPLPANAPTSIPSYVPGSEGGMKAVCGSQVCCWGGRRLMFGEFGGQKMSSSDGLQPRRHS